MKIAGPATVGGYFGKGCYQADSPYAAGTIAGRITFGMRSEVEPPSLSAALAFLQRRVVTLNSK